LPDLLEQSPTLHKRPALVLLISHDLLLAFMPHCCSLLPML